MRIIMIILVLAALSGCESDSVGPEDVNNPPVIHSIIATPDSVAMGGVCTLTCDADDDDNDPLSYQWIPTAGTIADSGAVVQWTAPDSISGTFSVTCKVSDPYGGQDVDFVNVQVQPASETRLRLRIVPQTQNTLPDQLVPCAVYVENAVDLFVFSCEIVFNSFLLEIADSPVQPGDFWLNQSSLEQHNESGILSVCIGLSQTEGHDGISGYGTLFSFNLHALQQGTSAILIQNVQLLDETGVPVQQYETLEIVNGSVVVE